MDLSHKAKTFCSCWFLIYNYKETKVDFAPYCKWKPMKSKEIMHLEPQNFTQNERVLTVSFKDVSALHETLIMPHSELNMESSTRLTLQQELTY